MALAGVRQAMVKGKVCKMLVIPAVSEHGLMVRNLFSCISRRMTSGLNQTNDLLAWGFRSTVVLGKNL